MAPSDGGEATAATSCTLFIFYHPQKSRFMRYLAASLGKTVDQGAFRQWKERLISVLNFVKDFQVALAVICMFPKKVLNLIIHEAAVPEAWKVCPPAGISGFEFR